MIAAHTRLGSEREFAGFGAPADAVCHARKPQPSVAVAVLQQALNALANRVNDRKVSTTADGLVGPHTVKVVNYAVPKYADAPAVLATGKLTHAQIVSFAPQIRAYVENAPRAPVQMPPPQAAAPSVLPAAAPAMYTRSSGGSPMPYAPPPQYYPPGYAPYPGYPGYAPRGPGGLPADHASVDTKVFIPAQYEHVQFNPATVALVLAAVAGAVLVMQRRGESK